MTQITPVILSGGSGTRLWPMSTDARPKQFLPLASNETMFADTLARCGADHGAPIIVGAARHKALLDAAAPDRALVILEPAARNTAPAIALAALAAGEEALLLVMPSDHVIADLPAFQAAVAAAVPAAEVGWLVTFGITPSGPETGFGYIAMGDALPGMQGVRRASRFIEKPPRDKAEAMLAEGSHAWNAGIFLFRAGRFIEELAQHGPAMLAGAKQALADGKRDDRFVWPDTAAFAGCPSDSIDYAVMERAGRVAVVPVSCGWSDVGSWDALAELGPHDESGNRISGDVVAMDSANNLIMADGVTVTLAGVSNLIVVASGGNVMIVPRGASQDVKRIVETLRARK